MVTYCFITGVVHPEQNKNVHVSKMQHTVDSLEFHWRTLVPLTLELYLSSTGEPEFTGAPGDAPGHGL